MAADGPAWASTGRLGQQLDLVGIGEPMVLFQVPPPGTLRTADTAHISVAGAELNVCAAIASLGGRAGLLSRVGDDLPGQRVLREMELLGVSREHTVVDATEPTAVFLRETPSDGRRQVTYYREGSAASTMDASDLTRLWASHRPRAVSVSGLTAALGPGLPDLIRAAAESAAEHGVAFVLDANLREGLPFLHRAIDTVTAVLPLTDLLALGTDESVQLFGTAEPGEVFAAARAAGASEVVLKAGADGCWYEGERGEPAHVPAMPTRVVDPIGAGDAFLGGYLGARLSGAPTRASAVLGARLAARVIQSLGDTQGLPSPEEGALMCADALAITQ